MYLAFRIALELYRTFNVTSKSNNCHFVCNSEACVLIPVQMLECVQILRPCLEKTIRISIISQISPFFGRVNINISFEPQKLTERKSDHN